MKFILAEKKEMTQKFSSDGAVIPVTKVVAGPCLVTQLKTDKRDGYTAVQIGFGVKKNLTKSLRGHLKNLGNFRYLKEFRIKEDESQKIKLGDKLMAKIFQVGDIIKVTGISKGKGFQGVVKRHGFHGSPASHGHKDQLRMPGSIGSTGPAHVFKGTRMAGQMGNAQVTVKNLKIVEVNPENNEIFIKGAIPGPRNNLVIISGSGDIMIEQEIKEEKPEKEEDKKNSEISADGQKEEKKQEKAVAEKQL